MRVEKRRKGVSGDSEKRRKGVSGDSEKCRKGVSGDSEKRRKGVSGDSEKPREGATSMSMRHLIVLSSLCLALAPARAVAQQRGTVGGVAATEELRQNLLNMARELDRAQNLERRA